MKWIFLLFSCAGALAQGGSYCTMSTWEPRNIGTKAGLVASYDPGNTGTMVYNPAGYAAGNGVSALSNLVTLGTADLLQGTGANQPKISQLDTCGNLVKQSEVFNTTWVLTKFNAFNNAGSNLDTGATGEGSHYNTTRITDPLGGNQADFLQEDSTASVSHDVSQSSISSPSGIYRVSVWVSPIGVRTNFCISIFNSANSTLFQYYDLIGSGSTASHSGGTWSSVTANISQDGSWYLCTLTAGSSVTDAVQLRFRGATNNLGSYTYLYNGDNTSGFFLWGASLASSTWLPVTGTSPDLGYVATTTLPIFAGLSGRSVLYFDGSAYRMKTGSTTIDQPNYWIVLANPWTWTLNDVMQDGVNNNSGKIYQADTTPKIRASAGTASAEFTPPPAGTWRVLQQVFDGANSRTATNSGAWTVSDAGTATMGGYTLGSAGTAGTTYWNGLIGRVIGCTQTNDVAEMNFLSWGLKKQAGVY